MHSHSASRHNRTTPCPRNFSFELATRATILRFDRPTKITRYSPRAKYANEDVGRDRCSFRAIPVFPCIAAPIGVLAGTSPTLSAFLGKCRFKENSSRNRGGTHAKLKTRGGRIRPFVACIHNCMTANFSF